MSKVFSKNLIAAVAVTLLIAGGLSAKAQDASTVKKQRTGTIYFSWGYNKEWYTPSTVHVAQPSLGNDYKMQDVESHDNPGWSTKSIFKQALTIPQYNYRLGYYFNERQDLAFEINFDHTKYIIQQGQQIQVTGTMANAPVNKKISFTKQDGFFYYLNNGANFLLFNLVKRVGLYHTADNNFRLDLTGKAGIGPVIPHVENMLFGKANDPHFQIGGWNAGVETALRVSVYRYAFLEFSQKVDYARYSGLRIYEGTARHAFGTYELILSAGFQLPVTRRRPLFETSQTTKNTETGK